GREFAAGVAIIDAELENILAGMENCRRAENYLALIKFAGSLANYLSLKLLYAERATLAQQARTAAEALKDVQVAAECDAQLGAAYSALPTGDRGENLKRAFACCKAALRVYTERDLPRDWAKTQNILGVAYLDLPTGNSSANVKRAIACFKAALRVYTER